MRETEDDRQPLTPIDVQKRLARSAAAELRLLKNEVKAEKRLADARARLADDERRLQRSLERVEQSRKSVAESEALLRERQRQRAAGPSRPDN